ncbi:hypothetical protein [Rhodanobacter lindaniclasticus]
MPRIDIVDADTPLGERLLGALSYPLRGAGLATCTALGLSHYVGLPPYYLGLLFAHVDAVDLRRAADCLLHTANGYADPPDVGSDSNDTAGRALTAIHLLVVSAAWTGGGVLGGLVVAGADRRRW